MNAHFSESNPTRRNWPVYPTSGDEESSEDESSSDGASSSEDDEDESSIEAGERGDADELSDSDGLGEVAGARARGRRDDVQPDVQAGDLRRQLREFLPRLEAANRDLPAVAVDKTGKRKRDGFEIVSLEDEDGTDAMDGRGLKRVKEEDDDGGNGEEEEEEDEEEDDGEPYIEMDLSLGVLEEKPDVGHVKLPIPNEDGNSESDDDPASDSDAANSGNVMGKLMGIRQGKPKRQKHTNSAGSSGRIKEI